MASLFYCVNEILTAIGEALCTSEVRRPRAGGGPILLAHGNANTLINCT